MAEEAVSGPTQGVEQTEHSLCLKSMPIRRIDCQREDGEYG